jgi:uncharacterized protein DUF4177
MAEVTRWEIWAHPVNITKVNFASIEVEPALIWTRKDKEGRTEWDKLQKFAADGWELVSVTPIVTASNLSHTSTLLYTFKRPVP